jgi:excinuclease ABC subunit A
MLTGVSGSGKSSLAMDVLYGERLRRYLDGLSAYTRRRIGEMGVPDVDHIDNLPSALPSAGLRGLAAASTGSR